MADNGSSAVSVFVEGPRAARITPDDHGPILSIIAWYCAVVMVLAVGTRMVIKAFRSLGSDDPPILLSLILAMGYVIAVSEQVIAGFGRREDLLSPSQTVTIQRAGFAADVLFVPTILFAKLSGILFILQLLVNRSHVWMARSMAVLTCFWGVAGLFVVGLQCGMAPVWRVDGGRCINILDFWTVWEAINITLDLAMMLLPTHVVAHVQMKRSKKAVVILAFSFRIFAVAASATRISYLQSTSSKPRYAFAALAIAIATVLEVTANILACCVPFMKAFMDAFDSGQLGVAPRSSVRSKSSSSYHLRTALSSAPAAKAMRIRADGVLHQSVVASEREGSAERGAGQAGASAEGASDGLESRESGGSERMVIQQTRAWTVRYDPQGLGGEVEGEGEERGRVSGTSSRLALLVPEITPA